MSPASPSLVTRILYLGLDVHKESIVIAVLPGAAEKPTRVDRVANDPKVLHKYFRRLAETGEIRACYEASGAGYVLQRALAAWGYACEVVDSAAARAPAEARSL